MIFQHTVGALNVNEGHEQFKGRSDNGPHTQKRDRITRKNVIQQYWEYKEISKMSLKSTID